MSIIEAAAMRCRTMADGSLRIECEVHPTQAQAAFALFGMPGASMALAALKAGYAQPAEPVADKPKGGELSKWLAIRCGEDEFRQWLKRRFSRQWEAQSIGQTWTECAAHVAREVCEVESRAELDNDPAAAQRFHDRIRAPWLASQEQT